MTISESSPPINTGIKISKKQDNISIALFSFKSNNTVAMKATETNIIVENRLFFHQLLIKMKYMNCSNNRHLQVSISKYQ